MIHIGCLLHYSPLSVKISTTPLGAGVHSGVIIPQLVMIHILRNYCSERTQNCSERIQIKWKKKKYEKGFKLWDTCETCGICLMNLFLQEFEKTKCQDFYLFIYTQQLLELCFLLGQNDRTCEASCWWRLDHSLDSVNTFQFKVGEAIKTLTHIQTKIKTQALTCSLTH